MPNWCENKMIVIGSLETISKLYKDLNDLELKENDGFFEKHIPTPAELLNKEASFSDDKGEEAQKMKEKYGAADWYWWRVNNWGTKWDIHEVHGISMNAIIEDKYALLCDFETAWAPPEEALTKLSEIFKNTYFYIQFNEPGMGFEGFYSCMNGYATGGATVDSYPKIEQIEDDPQFYIELAEEQLRD
jgi:hypothetical protein